jgi:hypothetical protein
MSYPSQFQCAFFHPFFRFRHPINHHYRSRQFIVTYSSSTLFLLLCLFTSSFLSVHRDYHYFFHPPSLFIFVVLKSPFLFLQEVAYIQTTVTLKPSSTIWVFCFCRRPRQEYSQFNRKIFPNFLCLISEGLSSTQQGICSTDLH